MKIGIDARSLKNSLTGIGRYTFEICRALSEMPNVLLYLYAPSPIKYLNTKDNIIVKTGTLNSKIMKHFWAQFILPAWVSQDDLDVFLGPSHYLPRFLPKNIVHVVTIHDLVWKLASATMRKKALLLEKYNMPFAIKKADQVIAVSSTTAIDIQKEFFIQKNKLDIIHAGTTIFKHFVSPDTLKKMGINRSYFLFVGTSEPGKNLNRLLLAYSMLSESVKMSAMLVIAWGKGLG